MCKSIGNNWFRRVLYPGCAEEDDASSQGSSAEVDEEELDDRAVRERRHGDGAYAVAEVPGGRIKVYWDDVSDTFKAVACCEVHGHECTKERTYKKSGRGRKAQGRPVGFLCAWLKRGLEHGILNAAQHKTRAPVSRLDRKAARLVCHGSEGGDGVLAYERSPRADESSEPERAALRGRAWQATW